jgi:hypothetical protein
LSSTLSLADARDLAPSNVRAPTSNAITVTSEESSGYNQSPNGASQKLNVALIVGASVSCALLVLLVASLCWWHGLKTRWSASHSNSTKVDCEERAHQDETSLVSDHSDVCDGMDVRGMRNACLLTEVQP